MDGHTSRKRRRAHNEVTCKRIAKRVGADPQCGFKIPLPSESTITEILIKDSSSRRPIRIVFTVAGEVIEFPGLSTGISNTIGLRVDEGGEIECMVYGIAKDYIVAYYEK